MKGKVSSSHHRETNTYRFQTFSERLAVINVDVARRVQRLAATPEDADTFFGESMRKWSELNYTQHFVDFKQEIAGTVFSFAQLIHHQKKIVSALLKHLQVPDSLAYQPLLDLLVQVARDLQSDFYIYFEDVLPVLVGLLQAHHHDTEILEQTFTCLSYLFKFLWRAMATNIKHVYRLISPLLSNQYREYINNFAAESFAFLMRKVKNFSELCDVMFEDLREHPDQVSGVGRLLFDSIKGVQKGLHTSSGKILPVVLEKLGCETLPVDDMSASVQSMFDSIAAYIDKANTEPVWTPLLDHIRKVHKCCGKNNKRVSKGTVPSDPHAEHLGRLLEILTLLIHYKKGLLVLSVSDITEVLTELLSGSILPEHVGKLLLKTASELLMAERVTLTFKSQSALVQLIYNSSYGVEHLVVFTQDIFNMPMFEMSALPPFMAFCARCLNEKGSATECAVQLLAEFVLHKAPPPAHGELLDAYSTYLLDFGSVDALCSGAKKVPDKLMKQLNNLTKTLDSESLPLIWAIIITVPHIRPLETKVCTEILSKLLSELTSLAEGTDDRIKDAAMCIIADGILALMQKQDYEEFFVTITPDYITNMLKCFGDSVHALRASSLYFKHASMQSDPSITTNVMSEDLFKNIFPCIEKNLSSPQPRVRLLTLQICSVFNLTMPALPQEMEDLEQMGVFNICLAAEKVEASVHTYRSKLMHLQKLTHDSVLNQLPVGPYSTVPLRYLISQLYVNFTLLWEPVIELIRSHAVELKTVVFWEVYESHLTNVADITESVGFYLEPSSKESSQMSPAEQSEHGVEDVFREHCHTLTCPGRPDHFSFRKLLWKAMQAFPEVCEPKSRIIVGLLFRFLENEFYPANLTLAPTQNVAKKEVKDQLEEEDSDNDDEEEGEELPVKKKTRRKSKQRPYNSILVTHLGVFTKFRAPKSLYGEPRLRELYYELLPHRSPEVQKVAFQCLMTYKNKAILPYRENMERLMDDKTFKNEIVLFSIDQEANVLHADHRADVLPVVIAIIYGKMQTKTGKDTGGRSNANVRRNIVFRFLAGCQQHELKIFFDLIFKPVSHYIKDDVCLMVRETIEQTDISRVVPLKKQQSLLTMTDIILQKLGGLIDAYLPSILRVLIGIMAQVSHLLDMREQLAPRPLALLKSIRVAVIVRLNQFFSTYNEYIFSKDEIEMIFKVAIWPQLELLPKDGIHSPKGLLNLFHTWSQHTRYFDLFRKSWSESEFCVLPVVVRLLNHKSASPKVIEVIMDIVYNLLTQHEEIADEGGEGEDMEEESMEQITEEQSLNVGEVVDLNSEHKDYPLGVQILLPHVPAVLDYIHTVVDTMMQQKGRSKTLPVRVLNVLARLSEYVGDGAQCGRMLSLLLPFLNRNLNRSVDVELSILKAIQHMVKLTLEPACYVRTIAKMFSNLSARPSRTALCHTLQVIAECDSSIKPLADVITKLNAWDARYMEEPDYLVRIEGYREAHQLVQTLEGDAYITHLLVIMHNATFFINTVVDMSLRDSASLCIQQLMEGLSQRSENNTVVNIVVKDALLQEVKAGLKLKSEVARHEYITLLSHLIKYFPKIPVFVDLSSLADSDVETDFFANMIHIQLHRRGRAMRKITKMMGQRPFLTETLTSYLVPLITAYLRDEAYLKQAVITDAVVETMGSVAQCLPWPQYMSMLKYYLNQLPLSLENQKLMVRVIVAILDSFHFDLKNSQEISATALKAPGVAKEEEKTIAGLETPAEVDKPVPNVGDATMGSESDSKQDTTETKEKEDEEEEKESEDGPKSSPATSTSGSVTVCSPGLATRIHRILIKSIIPQLHNSLTKKVKSDDEHKKAKAGTYAEDEEVLRVPIALALVKLMQSLPHKTLDFNLPGLLFKLCHFLRSRALDIRNTARDTLINIMKTLGPSYFSYVLKELRFTLKRGYQLHVLCFTTYMLLKSLEGVLSCGDLESSVVSLVQVFNQEIFGGIAEEKNVREITSKLMEAKSTKSYDSYAILAKFISKGSLAKVFSPLKGILETTTSHKTAAKVEDILHKLIPGLLVNSSLQLGDLMTFTYGITTEVMPLLATKKKKGKEESQVSDERLQPTDTLLVQPPPSRMGVKAKTHLKTNMHILVEFGLQVLFSLLKLSTLNHKTLDHAKLLDPFVPAISKCLSAKYVKVTSVALRCLVWVFKFPLPSLKSHVKQISRALFVLLKNYAAAGAASTGDNQELIDTCFKAVTVLVRDVEYYTIKTDELKILLTYAEQDIHDHTRQATAFSILKGILTRKLVVPEMHDVMRKIEELSITSHDQSVRQNCRQVVIKFLLNYPLGARIEQHLEFYVSQLEYEHDTGRQSALEMLAIMFEAFPPKLLHEYSGLFFVPLASQMVNDDSVKCRRQTALAMKQLFNQLETEKRDELFSMVKRWFEDDKMAVQKLASLVCGVIVEVETKKFERHLADVLPVVEKILSVDKGSADEREERQLDHLLYSVLNLLIKLVRLCNLTRRQRWTTQMSQIWGHVEQHLLYPHVWVRLASAELFGLLLAAWSPQEIVKLTKNPTVKSPVYLQENTMEKLHDLCGAFCKQLSSSQLDEALANQVLKNLVFLGKVLRHFPKESIVTDNGEIQQKKRKKKLEEDDEKEEVESEDKHATFEWLLSRLCREARTENANTPKEVLKRSCVFKWLAAMGLELGPIGLPPYLTRMLPVLVRELTDKSPNSDADLQTLGQEVLDLLKKTTGIETFTTHYATVLKTIVDKRQTRKRERAAELIANPEVAAKRKLKKNLAKQKAKKRKIEDTRPVKRSKKHKFVEDSEN